MPFLFGTPGFMVMISLGILCAVPGGNFRDNLEACASNVLLRQVFAHYISSRWAPLPDFGPPLHLPPCGFLPVKR